MKKEVWCCCEGLTVDNNGIRCLGQALKKISTWKQPFGRPTLAPSFSLWQDGTPLAFV